MRAPDVFRVPSVWAPPMVIVAVLVFAMTLVYFGSVVNPLGNLHGLPVGIVNEDAGINTTAGHVNLGQKVAGGLAGSPAVSGRLSFRFPSLPAAAEQMS